MRAMAMAMAMATTWALAMAMVMRLVGNVEGKRKVGKDNGKGGEGGG
jgi:hypothetical protein